MLLSDQRLATSEELISLGKLRKEIGTEWLDLVSPEVKSDYGLIRFLRASGGDISSATEAFRAGAAWRHKINAYNWRNTLILKQDPESASFEEIVSHYTNLSRLPYWDRIGIYYPEFMFHRHDKHSNPILIMNQDMIEHIFALMTVVKKSEFDEFRAARIVNLELYLDALSRHFKKIVKCVFIWNLAGMSRQKWKSFESKCVKTYLGDWEHTCTIAFPEQAHRLIGVNVPSWLLVIWNMVKIFIPGKMIKRVSVLGSSNVAEILCKNLDIPKASLPRSLGGNCEINTICFAKPIRTIASDFKSGLLEIPAATSRSIELPSPKTGVIFFGIYVHSGRELNITIEYTVANKKTSTMKRIDDFFRSTCLLPDRTTSFKLIFDNRANVFFPKAVDYVVAFYPSYNGGISRDLSEQ